MVFKPFDAHDTIRWYDEHSQNYDAESFTQSDDQYGGDVYRIELVRQLMAQHKPASILDVGCGTGEPMVNLLADGFNVRGFDFSPGMISIAKQKLRDRGHSTSLAEVGDLLDPNIVQTFGKERYDAVVANGILPYMPDREVPHRHLLDLIKPGGLFVSAYSNSLFDLTTFNRFTVKFHIENFIDPLNLSESERQAAIDGLNGLITNPDLPKSIPQGARDHIYVRGDNPFEIEQSLSEIGLNKIDILFYKFHAIPPLLASKNSALRDCFIRNSRAHEVKNARDWRGYFLASTFIIVCRKNA